jgi:succinate dehydrogenase/fumarate reductase flavoprotein subunit
VATGPFGIPYNRYDKSFNTRLMPIDSGGEGLNAMYECGTVMGKLEIGYRTPGPPEFCNAPGLEMFTALGGHTVWMNRLGERFLTEEFRKGDFGRSSITTAILRENFGGRGPAGINISHFSPEQHRLLDQVIPIIMGNYRSAGYDLTKETVPYSVGAPAGKGVNGAGARIDENGATNIPGLYAAGNCSDGAYVCLGQALDSCAIIGWWAARGAVAYATEQCTTLPAIDWAQVAFFQARHEAPLKVENGLTFEQVRDKLTSVQISLTPTYNRDKIAAALATLQQIGAEDAPRLQARSFHDLSKIASLKPALPILELVLTVMEHRKESRGNLMRDDYRYTDNGNWLKHTLVQRDGSRFRLWDAEIPADWRLVDPPTNTALHPLFRT